MSIMGYPINQWTRESTVSGISVKQEVVQRPVIVETRTDSTGNTLSVREVGSPATSEEFSQAVSRAIGQFYNLRSELMEVWNRLQDWDVGNIEMRVGDWTQRLYREEDGVWTMVQSHPSQGVTIERFTPRVIQQEQSQQILELIEAITANPGESEVTMVQPDMPAPVNAKLPELTMHQRVEANINGEWTEGQVICLHKKAVTVLLGNNRGYQVLRKEVRPCMSSSLPSQLGEMPTS